MMAYLGQSAEIADLEHMIGWYERQLARAKMNGYRLAPHYESLLNDKRKKLAELRGSLS